MRFGVKEHSDRLNGIRIIEPVIDRRDVGSDNTGADEGWVDIAANARPQDSGGTPTTTFSVTLEDFATCNINPGGEIDVANNAVVRVDSSSYTMTHRMGTMASSPTFTLIFRTEDNNNEGFIDSKSVDNGCSNEDDTLSGGNSRVLTFDLSDTGISGVDLGAILSTGTVIQSCSDPPTNVDCTITGSIAGEGTVLGDFDSNKMTITLS